MKMCLIAAVCLKVKRRFLSEKSVSFIAMLIQISGLTNVSFYVFNGRSMHF